MCLGARPARDALVSVDGVKEIEAKETAVLQTWGARRPEATTRT